MINDTEYHKYLFLVDTNPNNDYLEAVGWYIIDGNSLKKKIKRAIRRGGQIPITQMSSADLSDVTNALYAGKGNASEL